MPRLSDVPRALRRRGLRGMLMDLYTQITEDNVLVWASALSYSWLLAMFPFILFLITLLPYIPEDQKQQVMGSIQDFLRQLPKESSEILAKYVDQTIGSVLTQSNRGIMSIGLILTLWAASGGMASTMSALDRCYDYDTSRSFFVQRPLAILLTIVVSILMLLVVVLLPVGGIVLNWLWENSQRLIGYQLPPALKVSLDIARWLLGLYLLMLVLNVVYHFGCGIRRRYHFLTPGSIFCVLGWVLLAIGFRYYIDTFAAGGYNKTYGAVGGVVILLFLMYLAATILLIGAEINSEIDYLVLEVPRGSKDFRPAEDKLEAQDAPPEADAQ